MREGLPRRPLWKQARFDLGGRVIECRRRGCFYEIRLAGFNDLDDLYLMYKIAGDSLRRA